MKNLYTSQQEPKTNSEQQKDDANLQQSKSYVNLNLHVLKLKTSQHFTMLNQDNNTNISYVNNFIFLYVNSQLTDELQTSSNCSSVKTKLKLP